LKKVFISFISKSNINPSVDLTKFDEVHFLNDKLKDSENELEVKWRNVINNFSSKKIKNKTVLDYTAIDDKANIWFYNKFRIFHSEREAFYELSIVNQLINNLDSFHVASINLNNSLFNTHNIVIENHQKNKKQKKKYATIAKYGFVFMFRYLISKKIKMRTPSHIIHGLVNSEIKIYSIINPNKETRLNSVWGYLAEKYTTEFCYIEDIPFPSIYSGFKLKKRYFLTKYPNTYTNEFILLNSFSSRKLNKVIKQSIKTLLKNTLILKEHFLKSEDILLINALEKIHSTNSLYIRKYYAYKYFFKSQKCFKSISTYGENLSQGKIILDAAKKNNIKTYGIQHGMISSYNMGYNFSQFESSYYPMPDCTFSWGEFWKKQLITHGNYPPNKIINVGQSRADIIPLIKNSFLTNENIITFFTQPHPDKKERFLAAESFIKIAKSFTNLSFVLKLHPAEKDDIYTTLINKYKVINVTIENIKSTYQLLAESGLTITCYSTVGIESLYFGNPVITFDSKGKDLAGYIKDNIAYWAKNEHNLHHLIQQYINKKLPVLNTENFIDSVSYKIDGKVNERIKNIILGE
jgi:hypothetical protein